jgi:signal transduction histidine kinase
VQESLNNIAKHASATSALISLRKDAHVLILEIQDDGIGFDSDSTDTGQFRKLGNFGRLGMRERALNSDGVLDITSSPGHGTRVLVEWTLTADDLSRRKSDD